MAENRDCMNIIVSICQSKPSCLASDMLRSCAVQVS